METNFILMIMFLEYMHHKKAIDILLLVDFDIKHKNTIKCYFCERSVTFMKGGYIYVKIRC